MLVRVAFQSSWLELDVESDEPVSNVKAMVFDKLDIGADRARPEAARLLFGVRELDDGSTLYDYGVSRGAQLRMFFAPPVICVTVDLRIGRECVPGALHINVEPDMRGDMRGHASAECVRAAVARAVMEQRGAPGLSPPAELELLRVTGCARERVVKPCLSLPPTGGDEVHRVIAHVRSHRVDVVDSAFGTGVHAVDVPHGARAWCVAAATARRAAAALRERFARAAEAAAAAAERAEQLRLQQRELEEGGQASRARAGRMRPQLRQAEADAEARAGTAAELRDALLRAAAAACGPTAAPSLVRYATWWWDDQPPHGRDGVRGVGVIVAGSDHVSTVDPEADITPGLDTHDDARVRVFLRDDSTAAELLRPKAAWVEETVGRPAGPVREEEWWRRHALDITVRRDAVYEDVYAAIGPLARPAAELGHDTLHVRFHGEDGYDLGGVRRECFDLAAAELADEARGVWRRGPGGLSPHPLALTLHAAAALDHARFAGRVCALAARHAPTPRLRVARWVWRHCAGAAPELADLEAEDPEVAKGLRWVLDADADALAAADLSFVAHGRGDAAEAVAAVGGAGAPPRAGGGGGGDDLPRLSSSSGDDEELCRGGAGIAVTPANSAEYVRLAVRHRLAYDALRPQLDAFAAGVSDLVPGEVLRAVGPSQWQHIVAGGGTEPVCLASLRAATEYVGYDAASPQVTWLWEVLDGFDDAARRRFVAFATGGEAGHLPRGGGAPALRVVRQGGAEQLPTAATCERQLHLPPYASPEQLERRLRCALEFGGRGFGSV